MKNNASNNDLLSQEQIRDVTGGAINKKKQASILDAAKIYYWWGADGNIKTTWHHVHHPMLISQIHSANQPIEAQFPNFDHLGKVAN